jgi:hypothetical protein
MRLRLWCVAFLGVSVFLMGQASALCESFGKACSLALGQPMTYSDNTNYIKLLPSGSYYISFSVKASYCSNFIPHLILL